MAKIEIIPAIDVIDGKCVRLSQGDYAKKIVYNQDPLEVALMFESAGLNRLHLVDLDGAKAGRIINYKVLEDIAARTRLVIDFGGGLKSDEDLRIAFSSGAAMVTGGSIAVRDRERFLSWMEIYGQDKIILGADAREGKISVGGWLEDSSLELIPFIAFYKAKGISKVISTDIARDGMLQGPAFDMYEEVLSEFPDIYLIASGGVSSMADITSLQERKIQAVITGKALYEGRISLKEIEKFNQ